MDAKPRLTSGIEGEEMFPKPVRDLMIFVQEAVSKIDSGNTDSVTVRVKQRFRKLLSDSGFRPEKIDEALEQSEPTPLAQL